MFDENNKLSLKLNNPGSTGFYDVSVSGPKGGGGTGGRWVVCAPYNPHTGCTLLDVQSSPTDTLFADRDWTYGRW